MPKTVTLRLKDEVYKVFVEAAQAENRPLSNFIESAAFARVSEEQFADDVEIAAIQANQDLVNRINKGCQEARTRKGRFVE